MREPSDVGGDVRVFFPRRRDGVVEEDLSCVPRLELIQGRSPDMFGEDGLRCMERAAFLSPPVCKSGIRCRRRLPVP